ncbi:MAG: phosphopantetheine-binding protein [Acutalibacteraceae bacterium]|jgi:acyl carrier protein
MVLETVAQFAAAQCGCDPDEVEMPASLDDLGFTDDDRSELAVLLEEQYMVEIPTEALAGFVLVEDVVGYVEDRL